jgi:hypothetical protein
MVDRIVYSTNSTVAANKAAMARVISATVPEAMRPVVEPPAMAAKRQPPKRRRNKRK